MNTRDIQIDFEVHREIEKHRQSFDDTPNSVLRRLLGIANSSSVESPASKPSNGGESSTSTSMQGGILTRYCTIPNGTKLRKLLKGILHEAQVREGMIFYKGKTYDSPSAAGCIAANNSVNGWIFWEYFDEKHQQWFVLDRMRKRPKAY
jgi:hypothetical protein